MPRAFFNASFNDIHELKCSQAEEKLEAGGDEKLILFGLTDCVRTMLMTFYHMHY